MKPVFVFFHTLNPVTFPCALLLRIFGRVFFWRTEHVSRRLAERWLTGLDPVGYFTNREWKAIGEDVFVRWHQFVKKGAGSLVLTWKCGGQKIDYTASWLQRLAIQVESETYFQQMVLRWMEKNPTVPSCSVAGTWLSRLDPRFYPELPVYNRFQRVHWVSFFDVIWLRLRVCIQAVRQMYFLLFQRVRLDQSPVIQKVDNLWSGISASELASEPGKLDIAFLIQRGLLHPEDSLYLLQALPSLEIQRRYAAQGAQWEVATDYSRLLLARERWSAAFETFWILIRTLLPSQAYLPMLMQMSLCGPAWVRIAQRLRPRVFLSSVSASWPESPVVAVMNACGVRTVVWHYSTNVFGFVEEESSKYQDLNVSLSVAVSREAWIWNLSVQELLTVRSVLEQHPTRRYKVVGPVMCGDFRWMLKSPAGARREAGVGSRATGKYISVFDVPPVSKAAHLELGFLSPYTLEMLDQFFQDLGVVMDLFPDIHLILKPKRALSDPQREYPSGMWRLLDPEGPYRAAGRIILLEHDCDPYVGAALADLCIGLPFTSPVFVGMKYNRQGIFHDPLGTIRTFRQKALEKFITHGQEELLDQIREWLNKPSHQILDSEMEAFMGPAADPAELFVQALKDVLADRELSTSAHSVYKPL